MHVGETKNIKSEKEGRKFEENLKVQFFSL
jgi:hypothetical protein